MRHIQKIFLLILIFMFINNLSFAQKYGRNKVQYENKDWEYIQTRHFDLYYYQGGRRLAEFAASVSESSYVSLSKLFNYELTDRIPIIIYRSHNDFTETNTSPTVVEESVGGFTEFLKNRVVIPFDGSFEQFRHVIHHELTHAVMLQFLYGSGTGSIIQGISRSAPPLWFIEGLAEYTSIGWDTESDMYVRDATLAGYLPPIPYLQAFLAYKGGQAVLRYVEDVHGRQKVTELLQRLRTTRNFSKAWRSALNEPLEESNKKWQQYMRKKYWPEIANRKQPDHYAQTLTDHTEWKNFINNSPAVSPTGDRVAFLSDRSGYFDIYMVSATDKKQIVQLVSGQKKADLEELQWLRPGMSWSPDGKYIAFTSRAAGEDALNILDVDKRRIKTSYKFGLDGLFAPAWSPVTNEIAFVGVKNCCSDIYIYNYKTEQLRQLTNDIFSDAEPHWSPDGTKLVFISDRKEYIEPEMLSEEFGMENHDYHTNDIYIINADGSDFRRLTNSDANETSPEWSPKGKYLLYISDESGISNIYYMDMETDETGVLTDMITGIVQISVGKKSDRLAFTAFSNAGYDIYIATDPLSFLEEDVEPIPTAFITEKRELEQGGDYDVETKQEADKITTSARQDQDFSRYIFGGNFRKGNITGIESKPIEEVQLTEKEYKENSGEYKTKDYKIKFSIDNVGGYAGYDPFFGFSALTQLYLSDMLGDHQILIGANIIRDLNNSDFLLGYSNLKRRLNWSVTGFQFVNFFYTNLGTVRFLRRGLAAYTTYPLSRFRRIEVGAQFYNIIQDNLMFPIIPRINYSIFMPNISYSKDNSIWGYIGPSRGSRYYLSVIGSPKVSEQGKEFFTTSFDFRHYISFGREYTFAMRFAGGASYGKHPTLFIMGGVENWLNYKYFSQIDYGSVDQFFLSEWMMPLRGAYLYEKVGTRAALINMEFRFPFVQYFITRFPLPIGLQNIQGSFFVDIGSAWSRNDGWRFLDTKPDGSKYVKDVVTGFGYGIRVNLYIFLLRLDAAWRTDFDGISSPMYYWSLGLDF